MSAKVGIPMGIFNFPGGKKIPQDFQKFTWENIRLDWKGNKFHGKNSVN